LDHGSEDDLSSIGHGKSHPEDKDELEDIVEGYRPVSDSTEEGFVGLTEPVDSIDQALKNVQEGIDNPVLCYDELKINQSYMKNLL
jgi:hypothetical protein